MEYVITVGLEIHLKLSSQTKIFCPCKNDQSLEDNRPNTHICPTCTGQPGALPRLSRQVVQKALLLGKAMNCQFNIRSSFDRKNYFYPDLPMGYQITQFYTPINVKGQVSFFLEGFEKELKVGITEAHLECDTAKSFHQGGQMLLDFNRAGTPLIEIVTGPDFDSAEAAVEFAKEIQRIAKRNDISDADMEKGQMRVDVNVSIRPSVDDPFGTRVELKNINSFSAIKRAIDAEVARQIQLKKSGETLTQETRRRDDLKGVSFAMRSKEDALDYRYFPEPDLPDLVLDQELLDQADQVQLLIPSEKIRKMKSEYGFHKEFINALIGDLKVLNFFEEMVALGYDPKMIAKWIAGPISAYMTANFVAIDGLKVNKEQLISFFSLVKKGSLIDNQLKLVMEEMLQNGGDPEEIVKEKGFDAPAFDESELKTIIQSVLDANESVVDQYRSGKTSVIGFLV
ncbi:Asp-tRNA(Asn)/Glu-tRNA(Gln) amidotransferase subunit GatB, partial [Candidatus Gracilibacteria bacterium]|nr:Asp-tRNA(Asn)/Glu-tRNA(Gln) amidotransferase subunit GatB [Candidatus Gracilibacteria bacterium]